MNNFTDIISLYIETNRKIRNMWITIENLLKESKISIYQLAKLTKIPDSTLRNYKYKHSEISFKNACKIADALGVSLDELR